jgi:peptidyl-dipeptidase Dcp
LEDGVFYAANQLYGLTFRERHDIPVYHPDVRVFDVLDAEGSAMALFYADLFKRDNKDGGARSNEFVHPSGLRGTKPVVINVANLTKPAPGEPALIDFDDVITLFHELGHALHTMFTRVQYPTSLHVPADFSEFPSQFNEHWAFEPRILAHYAKHYQTGAPMPEELVERFRRARTFNQGFATTEYVAAALLDLAWHTLPKDAAPQDVGAFEAAALKRHHFDEVPVPPRYRTSYFAHIWDSDYQANYGSYMWAEVLDDDAYAWFEEHGGLTRENGQRYRELILARGNNAHDLAASYREFRGRDPRVEALLQERGLSEGSKH